LGTSSRITRGSVLPPGLTLSLAAAGMKPMASENRLASALAAELITAATSTPAEVPFSSSSNLVDTFDSSFDCSALQAALRQQQKQQQQQQQQHEEQLQRLQQEQMDQRRQLQQLQQMQQLSRPRAPAATRKPGPPRNTLRSFLHELRNENPRRVFVARRTNQLGFRSRVLLDKHFSKYGEVTQVMVAHSKVKSIGDALLPRTRPGNLGLIVMKSEEAVQQILIDGPAHIIPGVLVNVHRFDQKNMDREECSGNNDSPSNADESTASGSASNSSGSAMGVAAWNHPRAGTTCPPGLGTYAVGQDTFQQQNLHHQHHYNVAPGGQPRVMAPAAAHHAPSVVLSPPVAAPMTRSIAGMSEPATPWCHPRTNLEQSRHQAALRQLAQQAQQAQQSLKIIEEMCTQNLREIPHSEVPPLPRVPAVAPVVLDTAVRPPVLLENLMHQYRTALQHCDAAAAHYASATAAADAMEHLVPLEDAMRRWGEAALAAATAACAPNSVVPMCQTADHSWEFNTQPTNTSAGTNFRDRTDKATQMPRHNPDAVIEKRPSTNDGEWMTLEYLKSNVTSHREPKDTLVSHLARLQTENPACVFVARGIAKLGFRSKDTLRSHYSRFGKVSAIFTAHSKTKLARDSPGAFRTRPGSLGLVTMATSEAVQQILALGERQEVGGHEIHVQPFRKPPMPLTDSDAACDSSTQAAPSSHGAASTATPDDQSNGSGNSSMGLEGRSNETRSEGSSGDADVGSSDGSEGNGSSPSR